MKARERFSLNGKARFQKHEMQSRANMGVQEKDSRANNNILPRVLTRGIIILS